MAIDRRAQTARFLQNCWSYRLAARYRASLGPSDHEYHERFRLQLQRIDDRLFLLTLTLTLTLAHSMKSRVSAVARERVNYQYPQCLLKLLQSSGVIIPNTIVKKALGELHTCCHYLLEAALLYWV